MDALHEQRLVSWTHVIYGLHALSLVSGIIGVATVVGAFLTGWPSIIAVILNYVKRGDVRGTWLESHFRWQIRTFWYGLFWVSLCVLFGDHDARHRHHHRVVSARHREHLVHLPHRPWLDRAQQSPADVRAAVLSVAADAAGQGCYRFAG